MADGPTQQNNAREQVEDEAAEWVLRLSECSGDVHLEEEIAAWCGRSALHREIWARTQVAYDTVGKAPPRHEAHWASYLAERQRPVAHGFRSKTTARPARRRRFVVAAAVAALAACIAFVALPALLLRLNADHVTSTAELRVLVLNDGSRVHLAPRSAVDVAFGDRERRIRLLTGQAFFEVERDTARPFVVASGEVETMVLGTKFDVRLDEGVVSVGVREGHVRVTDRRSLPTVARELLAGDILRVSTSGVATFAQIPASDVGDWSEGRLVARHRPVSEIVDRIRGYYGGTIVMSDHAFAQLEVSGVYDPAQPVRTLDNLARLHGATMRQISPWLIVVTPF